ncbi:short-chain fatty acid transporter [Robertkochia marina]|uniref:Short-chain fatty acid transporter n=1 Tax=Robertkochia marina TaxID=1227945 RepID=A0A4S3M1D6_9FLAO|nr:TIGR00366 family protein [Robertkochia marina]THD67833.1 short-chain fatty acid transporter [Robertkochia marina]TRZ42128.1 short-chain fatty acid transporter [Robertkochia marina]
MTERLGKVFTDVYKRNMPDAFVFALLLTVLCTVLALIFMPVSPLEVVSAWYEGFWMLLEFGMQMVLLVITGYSIALSPFLNKRIDALGALLKSPRQVYFFVTLVGCVLCLISWGWIIITAILARELALRVKGVHYPYLIACVYCSFISWVTGLSSSIPLLLNTENNFLIEAGVLKDTIGTALTLGSGLNLFMIVLILLLTPLLMLVLMPRETGSKELSDLLQSEENTHEERSIKMEAESMRLPGKNLSDVLNNNFLLQLLITVCGFSFILYHFYSRGLDLNLNIMIFIFLMLGMLLHRTPLRYGLAMKRASSNVSAILFQFPFYAGIMGIMIHTGLANELALWMSSSATATNFPVFAYVTGGLVNFAIPSAGGEFAVIGPSVLEAVGYLAHSEVQGLEMMARSAMAIAYGESLSNLLQPFFLLLVIPVMAKGIKIQARDVMGYLVLPFIAFFLVQILVLYFWPL